MRFLVMCSNGDMYEASLEELALEHSAGKLDRRARLQPMGTNRWLSIDEVLQSRLPKRDAPPITPPPRNASDEIEHARTLGLRGRVTFGDIKRCYRERMQEYHPDKVASLGPKLREVAESEAKKINAAYEFFTRKYRRNA